MGKRNGSPGFKGCRQHVQLMLLSLGLPLPFSDSSDWRRHWGSQREAGDGTGEGGAAFHIWLACPWKLMAGESFALDMQSPEITATVGSLTYPATCEDGAFCRGRRQSRLLSWPPDRLAAGLTFLEESCVEKSPFELFSRCFSVHRGCTRR